MGLFKVECRCESTDHGAEPDFIEEVEAADADGATEIVCDTDTAEHFVISRISEWHEATQAWVDVDDPDYAEIFEGDEEAPAP